MKSILYILLFFMTTTIAKAQVTTVNAVLANPCSTLNSQQINNQLDFSIYPNPSNGIVNIKINTNTIIENPQIVIYDMKGILIYQKKFENNKLQFEKSLYLPNLSKGVYLLSLISKQKRISKKLIINK